MSTIGSLMKTDLVTAEPDETVIVAAERMANNGIGALMVVKNDELLGMLSERDIVERVVAAGRDPETTAVERVATSAPEAVTRDTRVRRCAEILRSGGFRHLPVVDGKRPIGILSARDLFEHVVGSFERVIDREEYRQLLGSDVDPYDHPGGAYGR